MRIPCPYCGDRDSGEFTILGDATVRRPDPDAPDAMTAFHDYVHIRRNPAGEHQEYWYHSGGCRAWLVVTRHTVTHAVLGAVAAREVAS